MSREDLISLGLPERSNSFYNINKRYRLDNRLIFVFGSNERGIHGKGAARVAYLHFGAIYGQGDGLMGRSYGIPTKETPYAPLDLSTVKRYIEEFVEFTQVDNTFCYVTPIGTGLAGFRHHEIAPLFKQAKGCWFPNIWQQYLYR